MLRASTLCALLGKNENFRDCANEALRKMFRPFCETRENFKACMLTKMPRLFRKTPLVVDENNMVVDSTCTLHRAESEFLGSLSCCADRDDILDCVANLITKIAQKQKLCEKIQEKILKFRKSVPQNGKVAFIEMTTSHSELLGLLTEMFEGWTMDTYINTHSKYSSLPTFRDRINQVFDNVSNMNNEEYDAIVFLTGSQWWNLSLKTRTSIRSKTVLIVHYLWEILELSSSGTVILPISPFVSKITKVHVLPVFKPSLSNNNNKIEKKNVILILGMRAEQIDTDGHIFKSKDLDDLKRFISNVPSSLVVFLVAQDKLDLSNVLKPLLQAFPNRFVWKSNCNSECLESLMNTRTRYVHVLSSSDDSYHRFRLTASIPLALSYGVPFIVHHELADLYGIRSASLVYENSSTEVIPKLLDISEPAFHESKRLAALGLRNVISRRTKQQFWGLY